MVSLNMEEFEASLAELDDREGFATYAPNEPKKLGYFSAVGLIVNSIIGTGIFNAPSIAINETHSTAITLLFWFAGAIAVTAASYLYIEFANTTPRYVIAGKEMAVPRAGGEINYLSYTYRRPAYLSTCIFGITFIIFGNMAGNCIAFAENIYLAAVFPNDVSNAAVRGIAIAVATIACLIPALSRRSGLWLSNGFAFIKISILLLIVITGFCAYGGIFNHETYANTNLSSQNSFTHPSTSSHSYAEAFLAIVFAYGGWNQANIVVTDIKDPKKNLKRAVASAVALVVFLYMLVNIVYTLVVPKRDLMSQNASLVFFQNTFGQLSSEKAIGTQVSATFIAISSFGNIVAMAITAARVNQELATTCTLPWKKWVSFIGRGHDFSFHRLSRLLRGQSDEMSIYNRTAPVGALLLHWVFTIALILSTYSLEPCDTYFLLTSIYSYCFFILVPALMGISMLYLRLNPREQWKTKSEEHNSLLSCLAALFVIIVGFLLTVVLFIPPSGQSKEAQSDIPWYTTGAVVWATLGLGFVYWLCFRYLFPNLHGHQGKVLTVNRTPYFISQEYGYFVQATEIVKFAWKHIM